MVLNAKLFPQKMQIHILLQQQVHNQEEEMRPEDEGKQGVEDSRQIDELHKVRVFCCEVEQAQKHEHLHRLSEVEMHPNVLPLKGLAVNRQPQVRGVHRGHSHNRSHGIIVGDSDDQGDEGLFEAAEKPEILSD